MYYCKHSNTIDYILGREYITYGIHGWLIPEELAAWRQVFRSSTTSTCSFKLCISYYHHSYMSVSYFTTFIDWIHTLF